MAISRDTNIKVPSQHCLYSQKGENIRSGNFRPTTPSNCDGKLFFSLLSKKFTTFMTSNSYFDGETQKGFLPGTSGCVEHATISQEALSDARQNHRSICFAWVDLRNAFGSVRHMLVRHCLQRYLFPPHISRLFFDNYYPGQTNWDNRAHAWHRRVICRACTRLCLACVPVSIFLARVVRTTTRKGLRRERNDPNFSVCLGGFQGCVLSLVLFNICIWFQPLLDSLHHRATSNG